VGKTVDRVAEILKTEGPMEVVRLRCNECDRQLMELKEMPTNKVKTAWFFKRVGTTTGENRHNDFR
jgi:hypothetical protein